MDRERERILFLADITPARFPEGRSGQRASNASAIERAVADAKFSELFAKREMDFLDSFPGLKKRERGTYEKACRMRRVSGELLAAYSRASRNGNRLSDKNYLKIRKLYVELCEAIKSLFWIVDATPIYQKPLWRVCCQRL